VAKQLRATTLAAFILLALFAYLYFSERERHGVEEQKHVFEGVKKEDVTSIELRYGDEALLLQRSGEKWVVGKGGKQYPADGDVVSSMIRALEDMKIEKVISDEGGDLDAYGLTKPRVVIIVSFPGGKRTVSVGDDTPTGSGSYVSIDEGGGVLVATRAAVKPFVGKTYDRIRDRRVNDIDPATVTKVVFKFRGSSFEVERTGGIWRAPLAPQLELDQQVVGDVVASMSRLTVEGFVDDEPADLGKYGFRKPPLSVELIHGATSTEIVFGGEGEDRRFVKVGPGGSVYFISLYEFDRLPKSISDLRSKVLFSFDPQKISSLEVVWGQELARYSKEEGRWKVVELSNATDRIGDVDSFLKSLNSIPIVSFVDDNPKDLSIYGLDYPRGMVVLGDASGERAILFGKEEEDMVFAKMLDKEPVYGISKAIVSIIEGKEGAASHK
jgi:hypothetical protein